MHPITLATLATLATLTMLLTLTHTTEATAIGSAFPLLGGSTRASPVDYPVLASMGSTGGRVYGCWRYVTPNVTDSLNMSYTVDYVREHIDTIGPAWASAAYVNWDDVDARVEAMAGVVGASSVVLQVGCGEVNTVPEYKGSIADPNVIPRQVYLGYAYLTAWGTAARYAARGVWLFQIENELNAAYLASLLGQRRRQVFDSAWKDFAFTTELLKSLKDGVVAGHAAGLKQALQEDPQKDPQKDPQEDPQKDPQEDPQEDPQVPQVPQVPAVTQNLHTDIPLWVNKLAGVPDGYFANAAAQWAPLLDWLSFDAYPNMFIATPCYASIIGERTKTLVEVAAAATSPAIPVMLMETNYPACGVGCNASSSYPAAANFTEANQASCMAASVDAVFDNGGVGFFFFTVAETEGITPPPGGYSAEDVSALHMLAQLYAENGDPLVVAEWLLGKGHAKYLESKRFSDMLSNIVDASGAIDMHGHPKPVVAALKAAYAKHNSRAN